MSGLLRAGALVVLLAICPGLRAEGVPEGREPYQLLRTLQALQDQMARGDVAAHGAQRGLIAHIAERFAAADPAVWRSERNARAVLAFALSGGPPHLLKGLLDREPRPAVDERLLRGALAYLEGREADARRHLTGVDAKAVGGSLGAQVALIQSALVARDDPATAAGLLTTARLLAPGTLIEEAALRREIFLEGQRRAWPRLEYLAVQYMRRFRHSVYAGNFRERFAVLLTQLDLTGNLQAFGRVEAMLARFDGEARRDLYLFLARDALVHGRTAVASLAAGRARDLSAGGSADEERAAFYVAAARLVGPDREEAARALLILDAARLPGPDRLLLETVLDLAVQIGEPLGLGGTRPDPPPDARPGPVATRAERALAALDPLIEEVRR